MVDAECIKWSSVQKMKFAITSIFLIFSVGLINAAEASGAAGATSSTGEPWMTSSTRITRSNSSIPVGVSSSVYTLNGKEPIAESAEVVRTSRNNGIAEIVVDNNKSGSETISASAMAVFTAGLFGILTL